MNKLILIGGAETTTAMALEIRRVAKSEGFAIAKGDIMTVGVEGAREAVTAECLPVLVERDNGAEAFLASAKCPAYVYIVQGHNDSAAVAAVAVRALWAIRNLVPMVSFGVEKGIVVGESGKIVVWGSDDTKHLVSHEEFAAILMADEESLARFMRGVLGMADIRIHLPYNGKADEASHGSCVFPEAANVHLDTGSRLISLSQDGGSATVLMAGEKVKVFERNGEIGPFHLRICDDYIRKAKLCSAGLPKWHKVKVRNMFFESVYSCVSIAVEYIYDQKHQPVYDEATLRNLFQGEWDGFIANVEVCITAVDMGHDSYTENEEFHYDLKRYH